MQKANGVVVVIDIVRETQASTFGSTKNINAMKTNQHHFAFRNMYENIALIVFMLVLLLVSFFQSAKCAGFQSAWQ